MFKDKGLVIGIIATAILIGGGVFLMSRGGTGTPSATGTPVSSDILSSTVDYVTSGIDNGSYLPATASAKVTLVEFGDYECPACSDYNSLVKQLLTDFSGKINYVFRNYPLNQHTNAVVSAEVAEAAGLQGRYWQMHDKLYATQKDWSNSTDAKTIFVGYAEALGLDLTKFKADMDSSAVKVKIQKGTDDGNKVGLTETPTFYLNGVKLTKLTGNYADFKAVVSAELSK